MEKARRDYPWFVKGDLDGFFGLAVDNLVQVLVIVALCKQLCGFDDSLVYGRMLPGVAVSLFVGNIYYALHARKIARRDNNSNCTALPYGINTPSVFAYILFIMAPIYRQTHDADLTWAVGLVACVGSGLIEFLGAFVGGWVRRVTPRAALLSALAAIGVIFIASPFAFQIFERPLVALPPMIIVLVGYFARVRFPGGLPSGLVALVLGTLLAWTVPLAFGPQMMHFENVSGATAWIGFQPPQYTGMQIIDLFRQHPGLVWGYLGVIVPMGVINAVGSLQNIESAEAAGDKFSTGPCMAVNGIGSVAAGLFGSCFPTTIYIGHPGWKALGARCGYSIVNAIFFTIVFLFGLGALVVNAVPMEAGIAIVMWIGVIITAQCYEVVPARHYPAVAISFFPAVAAAVMLFVPQILPGLGVTDGILPLITAHESTLRTAGSDGWWPVGVYALSGANSGFIITCMLISAISAFLIDRRFRAAAAWCFLASVATLIGFQHSFRIEPGQVSPQELMVWQRTEPAFAGTAFELMPPEGTYLHRAYGLAAGYAVAGLMLIGVSEIRRSGRAFENIDVESHAVSKALGEWASGDMSFSSKPPSAGSGEPSRPPGA